ncbi:ABC-type glycerol-3-phosphate transport system, permease component [Aristaeella hokkaidonensis]|nr:ABC-type glycerol-3-phosphate transport system, permease component [Aristaeella hokkaidonensis]
MINQESNKEFIGTQRGIRDILKTIREGTRMSRIQLRFAMTVAIVLLIALFVIMIVAGERANNTVLVNEEAELLTDATTAERIFSADGKTLAFQEGYTWSGEGPRYILNERMTTSKPYWLTLSTESEIAEYEQVLGEGRFLQVENLGNNGIWVAMATEDEIKNVTKASEEAKIARLDGIKDSSWLQKGTDEDNKAAEAAFNKIRFIQFERLGNTHIRLRRGTDAEIQAIDNEKSHYEQLRSIALILVLVALGVFIFVLKSGKMHNKPISFRNAVKMIALVAGAVFLGLAVFMTIQADYRQDEMNRQNPMIMVIDGETTEDEEILETTASDQKFSFPDKQGATRTVVIPQRVTGLSTHRIIQYAALALLGILLAVIVYFFRYERDLGFPIFNTVVLILLMMVTLYPVLNTLATAFNEGTDAIRGGIGILPRKFSMKSVDNILSKQEIFDAAWVSASKTVIITVLNLFWTGMLAYALSRREYVLRKLMTTVMVLTMYVNAGLIPNYILISQTLNLAHTYWVYIIPTMFSCFNMIVIRTYILGLPDALVESAKIDGAGDLRIYWKIIFPLCMPVLATVALFVAVGSWNSWFDTRLYNAGQKDHKTLQYLLQMKILTAGTNANAANATTDALKASSKVEPVTIRAAITVISTVPILVVYPLLQKYFVTGMALGSVKG